MTTVSDVSEYGEERGEIYQPAYELSTFSKLIKGIGSVVTGKVSSAEKTNQVLSASTQHLVRQAMLQNCIIEISSLNNRQQG